MYVVLTQLLNLQIVLVFFSLLIIQSINNYKIFEKLRALWLVNWSLLLPP